MSFIDYTTFKYILVDFDSTLWLWNNTAGGRKPMARETMDNLQLFNMLHDSDTVYDTKYNPVRKNLPLVEYLKEQKDLQLFNMLRDSDTVYDTIYDPAQINLLLVEYLKDQKEKGARIILTSWVEFSFNAKAKFKFINSHTNNLLDEYVGTMDKESKITLAEALHSFNDKVEKEDILIIDDAHEVIRAAKEAGYPCQEPQFIMNEMYRKMYKGNTDRGNTGELIPFVNKGIVYGNPGSGKTSQLQRILQGKTGKGLYICKECEIDAPNATLDVITSDDSGKLDGILKSRITYDFVVVDVSNTDPSFCQKATRAFTKAAQDGKGGVIAVNCTGEDYLEALSRDYNSEFLAETQGKPEYNGERQALLDETKRRLRKIFTDTFTAALGMNSLIVNRRTSVEEDYE